MGTSLGQRSRIVYLRVSEAEHEQLKGLCGASASERNVSEVLRAAMQRYLVEHDPTGSTVRERELTAMLAQMQQKLEQMESRMEAWLNRQTSRPAGD